MEWRRASCSLGLNMHPFADLHRRQHPRNSHPASRRATQPITLFDNFFSPMRMASFDEDYGHDNIASIFSFGFVFLDLFALLPSSFLQDWFPSRLETNDKICQNGRWPTSDNHTVSAFKKTKDSLFECVVCLQSGRKWSDNGDRRRRRSNHFEESERGLAIHSITSVEELHSLIIHTNNWFAETDLCSTFLFCMALLRNNETSSEDNQPFAFSYLINLIVDFNRIIIIIKAKRQAIRSVSETIESVRRNSWSSFDRENNLPFGNRTDGNLPDRTIWESSRHDWTAERTTSDRAFSFFYSSTDSVDSIDWHSNRDERSTSEDRRRSFRICQRNCTSSDTRDRDWNTDTSAHRSETNPPWYVPRNGRSWESSLRRIQSGWRRTRRSVHRSIDGDDRRSTRMVISMKQSYRCRPRPVVPMDDERELHE